MDQEGNGFLETRFVEASGVQVRYADQGKGPVIVFIHGFPETLQTWRKVFRSLSGSFRVVAFDLKGCGKSGGPEGDYSPWGLADLTKAFFDVSGINKATVVGTDTGFAVAAAFALRHSSRVDKLVLMAGTLYPGTITAPEIRLLYSRNITNLMLKYMRRFVVKVGVSRGLYDKTVLSEEIIEEYASQFERKCVRLRTTSIMRSFNLTVSDLAGRLPEIRQKTLILWADHERFFSEDVPVRLVNDIPDARLEMIAECGHFIQEERAEVCAQKIVEFLREQED